MKYNLPGTESMGKGGLKMCLKQDSMMTLTIFTSDTMSMLAMSIFIPTPTGGPIHQTKSYQ